MLITLQTLLEVNLLLLSKMTRQYDMFSEVTCKYAIEREEKDKQHSFIHSYNRGKVKWNNNRACLKRCTCKALGVGRPLSCHAKNLTSIYIVMSLCRNHITNSQCSYSHITSLSTTNLSSPRVIYFSAQSKPQHTPKNTWSRSATRASPFCNHRLYCDQNNSR